MTEFCPELFERAVEGHKAIWNKIQDDEVNYSFPIPDTTLKQLFNYWAKKYPHKPYIYHGNEMVTYSECNTLAKKIGNGLKTIGVKQGDRINTYIDNGPYFIAIAHACFKTGIILVNSNPLSTAKEIQDKVKDCTASVVIGDDKSRKELLATAKNGLSFAVSYILIGEDLSEDEKSGISSQILNFNQLLQYGDLEPQPDLDISVNDIAVLQYTGGTTGVLKGCCQTYRAYLARILAGKEYFKPVLTPEDEEQFMVVLGLGMSHAFGFCQGMMVPLAYGGSVYLTESLEETLGVIQTYQPTVWPSVPLWIKLIVSDENLQKYDLTSLKCITCGAAPIPLNIILKVQELTGAKITEGYGMTEVINTITLNNFKAPKPGTVGVPYPNMEYLIVDMEDGNIILPDGEVGEIITRGDCVMKEYWNNPEETSKILRNGWLYTGDIGRIDETGHLVILDRKKDLIIVSGFNVFPSEIEEVIMNHPEVKDACAISIPDERRGEVPLVYVVLKDETCGVTEEELIEFCRTDLSRYKVPKKIKFTAEIPKTKNKKPDRKELRRLFNSLQHPQPV